MTLSCNLRKKPEKMILANLKAEGLISWNATTLSSCNRTKKKKKTLTKYFGNDPFGCREKKRPQQNQTEVWEIETNRVKESSGTGFGGNLAEDTWWGRSLHLPTPAIARNLSEFPKIKISDFIKERKRKKKDFRTVNLICFYYTVASIVLLITLHLHFDEGMVTFHPCRDLKLDMRLLLIIED
jgi:hypothetical protein